MKISETAAYNPEFPETFQWGRIDNLTACNVAGTMVNHIEHELRKPVDERHTVCGLRRALNIIAEYVEA